MIGRRGVIGFIGAMTSVGLVSARAQNSRKVARIGIVSIGGLTADMSGPLPNNRTVRAFLRGMAELGYVFGRDFVTEPRGTDRVSSIGELVDLKVDVIVATGGGTILSLLKQATSIIPIIMTAAPDPVQQGLARSLARPGGNLTGMSLQQLELTGKRLQLLRELVPDAQTTAIFWDPSDPELFPTAEAFSKTRGWSVASVEIHDPTEIAGAFKLAAEAGAGALLVPASGLLFSHANEIAQLAMKSRLPTMFELSPFVDVGGLSSYGADIDEIWRHAATYVDRILKGANPSELPIEQPTKFELVINLGTAKALGLAIPPSIQIRADRLIE
ncbi:ABC transporter substrate-binding protein [Bradyrhizobium sp. WYCCWR 13023]|uniref:ABC transporter substrate-binding protein n=2 Tax=Nitrobacteraceae TaxID=41294 RepID=A0A9X1RIX8_9BRAD|nr:ABC transporter substrate-binding protein [Bradyrhizobium zhengyangense]